MNDGKVGNQSNKRELRSVSEGNTMLRRSLYFQVHRLIRSRAGAYYQEFMRLEKATLSELYATQTDRLNKLLAHAMSQVPYYRDRVHPKSDLSLSDFPILTKSDIRNYFDQLMTNDLRLAYTEKRKKFALHSWAEVKSGGSTGMPTTVVHDAEVLDRNRASKLYAQHLCGFPLGVPYFRLWGNMRDIIETRDSFRARTLKYLSNEHLLNAYKMNNDDIDRYIAIINASPYGHMIAFTDSIVEMAKYIIRKGKTIRPLKSIMVTGMNLTDDMRCMIHQVFQAQVHNKYGSRDGTDIACECAAGGFHIFANNVFVEIVDEYGKPVPLGKSGRILVTLLFNYSFAIIRYDIGDIGLLKDGMCSCGRPFPLLERIDGRHAEILTNNDGGVVTPAYIIHLIGVVHNPGYIKRFQLTQTSLTNYHLDLEVEGNISESSYTQVTAEIECDLQAVLGRDSNISVRKVLEIPVTDSGKFLYTINKVNIS